MTSWCFLAMHCNYLSCHVDPQTQWASNLTVNALSLQFLTLRSTQILYSLGDISKLLPINIFYTPYVRRVISLAALHLHARKIKVCASTRG